MKDAAPGDVLWIPSPVGLRRGQPEAVAVRLPAEVSIRRGRHALIVAGFVLAIAVAILAPWDFGSLPAPRWSWQWFSTVGSRLLLALVALNWAAIGLSAAQDLLRPSPVLILNRDGLCDRRSGLEIDWTDVESARSLRGRFGYLAVTLTLRSKARLPGLFRRVLHPVAWLPLGRIPRGKTVCRCQTVLLDQPSHVLTFAILTLARDAGAEIHRSRFWPEPLPPRDGKVRNRV